MFHLPYLDAEERTLVKTKCPTCKEVTEQEYIRVAPVSEEPIEDPAELVNFMKLMKRLVICTQCATLRLIN